MKSHRNLMIGFVLLLAGVLGLVTMDGMMDRDGMKRMMKNMMGARLPPGINPADLPEPGSAGARLLAQYCTQCHEMPGPGMHSASEWPPVAARMNQRMQMMSGRVMMGMRPDIQVPTRRELAALIAYLQKHAQKTIDKNQYQDLNTSAGKSFAAVCSRCHALPDPKQFTADEWPVVVQRMIKNMKIMAKPVPDGETVETILGFLQKHAR